MTGPTSLRILAVASLLSCISATSSILDRGSATTATFSGSTATPSAINDTTPYFIELLGYSGNDSIPWGAEIAGTYSNGTNFARYLNLDVARSRLDSYSAPNFTYCDQGYEIQHASTNDSQTPPTLRWTENDVEELILGYDLQVSNDNSTCKSFEVLETVPFGFNVGSAGEYNG